MLRELLPSDIPELICVNGVRFYVKEKKSHIGEIDSERHDLSLPTFGSLKSFLLSNSYFILVMGSSAISIMQLKGIFFTFDSHNRTSHGYPSSDGSCVLLEFETFDLLHTYIRRLAYMLSANSFELTSMNVQSSIENRSLLNYTTPKDYKYCITKLQLGMCNVCSSFREKSSTNSKRISRNSSKVDTSKCVKLTDVSSAKTKVLDSGLTSKTKVLNVENVQSTSTTKMTSNHRKRKINVLCSTDSMNSDNVRSKKSSIVNSVNDNIETSTEADLSDVLCDTSTRQKIRKVSDSLNSIRCQNLLRQGKVVLEDLNISHTDIRMHNVEHNIFRVVDEDNQEHSELSPEYRRSIHEFYESIRDICIYTCSCCMQTNFREYMNKVVNLRPGKHMQLLKECLTSYKSFDNCEYICNQCKIAIYSDKVPKFSIKNKMGFPPIPPELMLFKLEEVFASPVMLFINIRELPVGGQYSMRGGICHVPIEISPLVDKLPRTLNSEEVINIKIKRKLEYKHCYISENIRPLKVVTAINYLLQNSDLYNQYNIKLNNDWLHNIENNINQLNKGIDMISRTRKHDTSQNNNEQSVDNVLNAETGDSDSDSDGDNAPPIHTMLDQQKLNSNKTMIFAPGEGKTPIFADSDIEYICFPTIFCGKKQPERRPVKVTLYECFKHELRSIDTRVQNHIPNIFWKYKHKQIKMIQSKVSLAVRRKKTKGKKITAAILLDDTEREKIVQLDEGYNIFKSIRNSPPYFESKKKNLMAMIRQLGIPTIFFSLSSADTRWIELLRGICLVEKNTLYTDQEILDMDWAEKCKLINDNPALCSRYFDYRVKSFVKHILKGKNSPFGILLNYFFRIEFQHRGSPHLHGIAWFDQSPKFKINTDGDVCKYIDKIYTCSSDVSDEDMQYLKLQKHKHTKTCQRISHGKKKCRFGAPWLPMSKTRILRPITDMSPEQITKYKEIYIEIITIVHDKNNKGLQSLNDILIHLKLSEAQYILAIRSTLVKPKIFLKRSLQDKFVNNYMRNMLSVWKGNHDIQYVLDAYSCVVYICDYMTKSQKGISYILQKAKKECENGNMDLKQSVRHMGNKFLNSVETSTQECCYDLLELPITQSSVKVEFISTCISDERVFVSKSQDMLRDMDPNSEDVKLLSNIDKYAERPEKLENWCLADFVAELELRNVKSKVQGEDNNTDSEDEMNKSDDKFENNKLFPLYVGSGKVLCKRKHRKVIRFVNYRLQTDPDNYYRERLLLYIPWRCESVDLYFGYDTYKEAFEQKKLQIISKMKIYEPLSDVIHEALEEYNTETNLPYDDLAPSTQHEDENDAIKQTVPSKQFEYLDPDRPNNLIEIDIAPYTLVDNTKYQDSVEMIEDIMSDEVYRQNIRLLNLKQYEFFVHIMNIAMNNSGQELSCLHGGAGTGKSTLLKVIYNCLYRIVCKRAGQDKNDCKILVVASTGKAAYNVRGTTVHAAFHVPANTPLYDYKPLSHDVLNTYRSRYRNLKWILCDEISMVSNELLKYVYLRLQDIKDTQMPFGGVNIITVGDLYQLQPVKGQYVFMDYKYGFGSLATNLWCEYFKIFELKEIM